MNVSVVIAAKNETLYVKEAIWSVLEQKGLDLEIIFVDDGSEDDTYDIVNEISKEYRNLKIFRNPHSGKCSAFNYGVSQAVGRFVCLFAGDDIMPPNSLFERWCTVKDYPVDAPVVGLCKLKTMSESKNFDGQVVPKRAGRGGFTGVSYLMSRRVIDKIFPVPEILPNEDTWMEVAVKYMPNWIQVHSDIIGCLWRVHSGNSINMQVAFPEYNRKFTPRMEAFSIFLEAKKDDLDERGLEYLRARVACEHARREGNMFKVLTCSAPLVDRLRALSATNTFFYEIRRRLFRLLSGF